MVILILVIPLVLLRHWLGFSVADTAAELGIAEGTVKVHVAAVLKALGVSNRTQAVLSGVRIGIVQIR